jgi:hypothetical protein
MVVLTVILPRVILTKSIPIVKQGVHWDIGGDKNIMKSSTIN